MNDLRQRLQHWWPPLVLVALSITFQGLGWMESLRYERALLGSEPWRLVSGHLIHLGWNHLLLNLAGLLLIWGLFGQAMRPWVWGAAVVACALTVSGGLYLRDPTLDWYVGLSGVLHGLLLLGALAALRRERPMALLLLAMVVAKLLWEQLGGASSATAELVGGAVIVNAHLYGALGGLLCAPLLRLRQAPPQ